MKEYRKATMADYIRVQGKMPEVQEKGGLFYIYHENMVVRTHINPVGRGTVLLSCDGKPVEFCVGLLRRFEGDPCGLRSRQCNGDGYDRNN
jgi:hypothetical protein